MGIEPIRIVSAVGIIIVLVLLVMEVRRWRTGIVTRRQKVLRVASALLMIAILAMILAGDDWVAAYSPFAIMPYWLFCFALGVALLMLILLDFKEVGLTYGEERERMFRDLSKPDEDVKNGE